MLAACRAGEVERRPADVAAVFHSTRPAALSDGPVDMGYLLWLPDGYADHPDDSYPLLIYLHGARDPGYDIGIEGWQEVLRRPLPLDQHPDRFAYIVLMPQSLPGLNWTDELPVLDELLDSVIADYRVDTDRIYLVGFSMGGAGVWGWGAYRPDRFAALVPIAGYWEINSATRDGLRICNVKDLPIWVAHSRQDTVVPITFSEGVVNTLATCGGSGEVQWRRFTGIGHDDTVFQALEDIRLYRWLEEQSRGN